MIEYPYWQELLVKARQEHKECNFGHVLEIIDSLEMELVELEETKKKYEESLDQRWKDAQQSSVNTLNGVLAGIKIGQSEETPNE